MLARNQWAIGCSFYSKPLYNVARTIPGMCWDSRLRAWIGYADAVRATVNALHALPAKPKLVVEPGLSAASQGASSSAVLATKGLRPYQIEGAEFLITHAEEGCILADDLGLGKTITALRAARALKGRTIVSCPSLARGVWRSAVPGRPEASPPRPPGWEGATVFFCEGVKPKGALFTIPEGTQIIICHHDILYAWVDAILAWNPYTFILDECQAAMSEKSRRSNAFRAVAHACAYRYGLSGTPMRNRPKDLWNVVDTFSEGRFGKKPFSYFLRYCGAKQVQVTSTKVAWDFTGASNIPELSDRLNHFVLRRTKSDVGMQLPPCTIQVIELDVPKAKSLSVAVALRNDAALRRSLELAADGKIPDVARLVEEHLESGQRVVCFCYRRVVVDQLARLLRSRYAKQPEVTIETVHGDVPQKERDKRIDTQPRLLICTMDTTETAIDLSYANVGLFAELDYEPRKLIQCIGRLNRFGQTRNTLIQFTVALGTTEELIRERDIDKLELSESLLGKTDDGVLARLAESARKSGAADLLEFYKSLGE